MKIDARGLGYRKLNELVRSAAENGTAEITIENVNGQRYIGTGIRRKVRITVNGVPGNDLGAFMDGPDIRVTANGQDAVGNTMNSGRIAIHGHAGDVLGYGMRGGLMLIQGDVGYRVGIHMKAYRDQVPAIVVGGTARDFLGEYMAGGTLVVLGLSKNGTPIVGDYCGTGMHGGVIYLRGDVEPWKLGKEVEKYELDETDWNHLLPLLEEFAREFSSDLNELKAERFLKLVPVSHRPYGQLYAY